MQEELLIPEQGNEPEQQQTETTSNFLNTNETQSESLQLLQDINSNIVHLNGQFFVFSVLFFLIFILILFGKVLKNFY